MDNCLRKLPYLIICYLMPTTCILLIHTEEVNAQWFTEVWQQTWEQIPALKCFKGMLQELWLKEDSEIAGRGVSWSKQYSILGVIFLHWKHTGKRCTGGDHSCSPSNGVSSEMIFLGVSLAVKKSAPSHVSATSCRKRSQHSSSCILPGGTWRLCNIRFSVLWQWGCSLTVSISSSKWRHAKPFPDSASTAWPHPHS